jgi:hypothetical protein
MASEFAKPRLLVEAGLLLHRRVDLHLSLLNSGEMRQSRLVFAGGCLHLSADNSFMRAL